MAAPYTTFPIQTLYAVAEWGLPVNVKDFGALGDGVADDTAAIQAAIDWAYNNDRATIYIPHGFYNISDTIWLDPPGNARVPANFASPPNSNFSLRLVGDGWGGSERPGTHLIAQASTQAANRALAVGPGQYMGVKGISVDGVGNPNMPRNQIVNGSFGIQILCANGGAHATTIEDCNVQCYYYAYSVGFNNGNLGDSNTLVRCSTNTVWYGFVTNSTQNFINSLLDCTFYLYKIGVFTNSNLSTQVLGGNFSTPGAFQKWFSFTTIGGWSFNQTTHSFPIHITGNASFIDVCDVFCINSPHMGPIPCTKVSWDSGTNTLTLQISNDWAQEYLNSVNWPTIETNNFTVASLINGLSPAIIYGAEQITTFWGAGIYAHGVHFESFNSVNRLAYCTGGWQASQHTRLNDCLCNWIGNDGSAATNSDDFAGWITQRAWPFMDCDPTNRGILLDNFSLPSIDARLRLRGDATKPSRIIGGATTLDRTNIAGPLSGNQQPIDNDNYGTGDTKGYGMSAESEYKSGGDADRCQALPPIFTWGSNGSRLSHINGLSRSPYVGTMPAPWVTPRLTPAMLDRLLTTPLPALVGSGGVPYDPVCGETIYQIVHSFNEPDPRDLFVRFHHTFWSWGQSLTVNWHMDDGTFVLYMDQAGLLYMFPGLRIFLGPAGPFNSAFVTEVNYLAGYCTIHPGWGDPIRYFGSPGLHTSGTVIDQEPYAVTKIGKLAANALTDAQVAGKKFYVGDQVWQKTPVGSGSMGWICTTAGVAGSGAVFKAMPNLAP